MQEVQDASKTSCTALGLLDSVQLLDMDHHVYFDNYYNSPDLIDLLYKRKTHACGTVRKNQKSLPLAVTQAKLKQGETVFCHKNNLWGTVMNPKSSPLTGVQYVSMHCVLILVLGYITLKRTTQVKY